MKIKIFHVLIYITIFGIAQSQNVECFTDYSGTSSLLSGSCDETINYSTSEEYPQHFPIYYIRVNIHFMLKEVPTNPLNFTETNDGNYPTPSTAINGYSYALELIEEANLILSMNQEMNLPCPNSTPNVNSRYRYIIAGDANPDIPGADGVYFHRDDDFYWFDYNDPSLYGTNNSADVLLPESPLGFGINISSEINIFFQERDVPDADKHVTGFADFPPMYSSTSQNKPFVILGNAWYKYKISGSIIDYSKILNHEIGHVLSLTHTWSGDACSDTPNNNNCWSLDLSDPNCDEDCEISNNIMDYNVENSALTPCQIGRAQYWLMNEPVFNYLLDDYCNQVDVDVIVNAPGQSIIWENKRLMKGNVIIKTGTTLTVKCVLGMPDDAKIVVERGARLVIDGGIVTSNCGELWQGIEVYGAGNYVPHPTRNEIILGTHPMTSWSHGVVYIKNGCTIEYARNGITTSKYDEYYNTAYYGGVILATDANFINNRRSVEFMQYNYNNMLGADDNVSEFKDCLFEVNDDYPCTETFYSHISMWNVHGVDFLGNTYKDLRKVCTNSDTKAIRYLFDQDTFKRGDETN